MTQVELGEVTEISRGNSYTGAGFTERGPKLIGMGEIDVDGFFSLDSARPYSGPVKEKDFLNYEDLAMSITDLTQDGSLLGRTAMFTKREKDQYVISHHLLRLRTKKNANPYFLRYLLMSKKWLSFSRSMSTGTTVRALSIEDVGKFRFKLPGLLEQAEKANQLRSLDEKLECNAKLVELLESEAHLDFARRFDSTPISNGKSLLEYVVINPLRKLKKGTPATYLGMSNMPKKSASAQNWQLREYGSGQRFAKGDVIMARITPCLENGKIALVDFLDDGEIGWGSTEFIIFAPKIGISPVWIYCLVRSGAFVDFAIQNMSGTSGRQRCPANAFDRYEMTDFDLREIYSFGERYELSFKKIQEIRNENRLLKEYRSLLIEHLFT